MEEENNKEGYYNKLCKCGCGRNIKIYPHHKKLGFVPNFISGHNSTFGMKGKTHSAEARRKISDSNIGRKISEEHRQKISLGNKGKIRSEETRRKISESHKGQIPWVKGRKLTEEHRRKIGMGNEGKIMSEETKIKLRILNKGKKLTKETRMKISMSNKGRIISEETRRKLSKSHKGKIRSEETKKRLSESHKGNKGYWKGKHRSEETKRKISLKHKGKKLSKETIEKMSGENSHCWMGGKSFEPYDKTFNKEFKRLIRKRDNQICMLCNIHREKLNRALHVHHVNYNKLLSIPQNCISLCTSCHSKTRVNRKYWILFFKNLLSDRYEYKYDEENIIINIGDIENDKK